MASLLDNVRAFLGKPSIYLWHDRYTLAVHQAADRGMDENVVFVIPDSEYIELYSINFITTLAGGVRSATNTYQCHITRGTSYLYRWIMDGGMASTKDGPTCLWPGRDVAAVTSAVRGNPMPGPIPLLPGDIITFIWDDYLATDYVSDIFFYYKRWEL